jgi:MtN3 and saliva related transmembrane protein
MNATLLGLIAGAFTTFASLPQIVYALKARSMKDVSLVTLSMLAFGIFLWLCYGIVIHALPVIVWNLLSLTFYAAQIALKLALNEDCVPARGAA